VWPPITVASLVPLSKPATVSSEVSFVTISSSSRGVAWQQRTSPSPATETEKLSGHRDPLRAEAAVDPDGLFTGALQHDPVGIPAENPGSLAELREPVVALRGKRAGDDVSEHEDLLRQARIGQHGVERLDVAVDVREGGDLHAARMFACASSRSGSSSPRR
jgi:hypothetical protein